MKLSITLNLFVLLLSVSQCKSDLPLSDTDLGAELPYDIQNPDVVFYLPSELFEVSGLAYSKVRDELFAINDELGVVYCIDKNTGVISDQFGFGRSGDYEGVAYHQGKIYVAESNSNVTEVDENTKTTVNKYNGNLDRDNNIEGITYNARSNSFLLAAKEDSERKGKSRGYRSLFQLLLPSNTIGKEPFIKLNLMDEMQKMQFSPRTAKNTELVRALVLRVEDFAPSGVAIHPHTNQIYVLSSKGSLMVVLDQSGAVISIVFFDQTQHRQPEGITFDPQGNLYIANEGNRSGGLIYKFMNTTTLTPQ